MNYRKFTTNEIEQLKQQGCSADDWAQITVALSFSCTHLHHVKFTGTNQLGVFENDVMFGSELRIHSGIYNAWLHNCTVGNNVLIRNIGQYIANYTIEDNVVVFDCGLIETVGTSAFGNGTPVHAISGTGVRRILLYNELSAHLAFLVATFYQRKAFVARVEKMIKDYCEKIKSDRGTIQTGAKITGCKTIVNVFVGEQAHLKNVTNLYNGSICSTSDAPVYLGHGCSCKNFIIQSGASLSNGVLLSDCLIGQGGLFDNQFSATHSVFFANCQGFHGESSSVFACPYTVTHHKSTLLIAGLFSFANAGSGTNQSNHAYKAGPIHYGITERGLKLASDSYIFWPAQIGAYSLVTGRHYKHPDTTYFPFSYLIEKNGNTYLLPGTNFAAFGTWRDEQKWPQRDLRKGKLIDFIHYERLNPYTVGCIKEGAERLKNKNFIPERFTIEQAAQQKGIELYELAESLFLIGALVERTQNKDLSKEALQKQLALNESDYYENWIDVAGLYCPKVLIANLCNDIESEKITQLNEISAAFEHFYSFYPNYKWAWAATTFAKKYGKRPDQLSQEEIADYTEQYNTLDQQYAAMIENDRKKEDYYYQTKENDND